MMKTISDEIFEILRRELGEVAGVRIVDSRTEDFLRLNRDGFFNEILPSFINTVKRLGISVTDLSIYYDIDKNTLNMFFTTKHTRLDYIRNLPPYREPHRILYDLLMNQKLAFGLDVTMYPREWEMVSYEWDLTYEGIYRIKVDNIIRGRHDIITALFDFENFVKKLGIAPEKVYVTSALKMYPFGISETEEWLIYFRASYPRSVFSSL